MTRRDPERFFFASFVLVIIVGLLAVFLAKKEKVARLDAYIQRCESVGGVAVNGPNHHLGCVSGSIRVAP